MTVRVQVAPGEQSAPDPSRGGDTKGINLLYRNDRTIAGVSYANVRNRTATGSDKATTVGIRQQFSGFSLSALAQTGGWEGTRTAAAPSNAASIFSRSFRSYMVGGNVDVGKGSIGVSYKVYDDRTASNFDATVISAAYIHPLSKRTQLYAGVTHLKNKNASTYAASDGNGAYTGVAPGGISRAIDLGITHFF